MALFVYQASVISLIFNYRALTIPLAVSAMASLVLWRKQMLTESLVIRESSTFSRLNYLKRFGGFNVSTALVLMVLLSSTLGLLPPLLWKAVPVDSILERGDVLEAVVLAGVPAKRSFTAEEDSSLDVDCEGILPCPLLENMLSQVVNETTSDILGIASLSYTSRCVVTPLDARTISYIVTTTLATIDNATSFPVTFEPGADQAVAIGNGSFPTVEVSWIKVAGEWVSVGTGIYPLSITHVRSSAVGSPPKAFIVYANQDVFEASANVANGDRSTLPAAVQSAQQCAKNGSFTCVAAARESTTTTFAYSRGGVSDIALTRVQVYELVGTGAQAAAANHFVLYEVHTNCKSIDSHSTFAGELTQKVSVGYIDTESVNRHYEYCDNIAANYASMYISEKTYISKATSRVRYVLRYYLIVLCLLPSVIIVIAWLVEKWMGDDPMYSATVWEVAASNWWHDEITSRFTVAKVAIDVEKGVKYVKRVERVQHNGVSKKKSGP